MADGQADKIVPKYPEILIPWKIKVAPVPVPCPEMGTVRIVT